MKRRAGILVVSGLGLAPMWTVAAVALWQPSGGRAAEPLWRQLTPRKRVEANPDSDYALTEKNGPWLILATSFTGEQGQSQAHALVMELRSRFNLPAYYYGKRFEMDDPDPGRGIDDYGGRIKRRYQRNEVVEHAVLVGEFPQIDDPEGQSMLERIKSLEPEALKPSGGEQSSQSLASVRQFYRQVRQQMGKPVTQGPMSHAMMTRNPLVPAEYFTPGIDPEVAKWNNGLKNSLLHCPGKYSIKVATFRGKSTLSGDKIEATGKPRTRLAKDDDPLVVAGQNAHKMCEALRERGWEAYEFHDRFESYVTVGSFDKMEEIPGGHLAPATREAKIIVTTFGAATPNADFEHPAYEKMGMKEDAIRKVERDQEQIKQQFNSTFSAAYGQVADGFYPKRFVGLPFDIQPEPVLAPKQSISSAYVRN